YHNLLPTYLQDVLKQAVRQGVKHEEDEKRFLDPAYVGELDRAIRRVRESFPQAFSASSQS
ncbi:MAG: hypothetical protein ACRCWR_13145, partial [Saezia sp.]